jgi:hypothetical protein
MAKTNRLLTNFSGGEVSPRLRGRNDLELYNNVAERIQNFIVETQGPMRFRGGSVYVNHTRSNNIAHLIPFQFNDEQSYKLEFTENYIRIFKDSGTVLETAKTITGITQANPGVITSNAHGYSDGDEIFISSVVGMTELNSQYYLIDNATINTYTLTDIDGNAIDTTNFTAYVSGGSSFRVYEISSPYLERHLRELKFTQNADTMYITHNNYEPRKLTRTSDTSWSLTTFTRTSDPFLDKKTITGITQANPGVVTSASHGYSDGDQIIIEDVGGMTEINGVPVIVAGATTNTFELTDIDGNDIDTTGFTAYTSGGYASDQNLLPLAVGFYESRLFYSRSDSYPERIWGSMAPDSAGVPRFDSFTTGTSDDDAVIFTLAPVNGKVDSVQWISGNTKYLAAGTFGGVTKITGGRDDEPITPSGIKSNPIDSHGCANIMPIPLGNIILYVQLGGLVIRSLEYNALFDGYEAVDRVLVADHITESGIVQLAFSNGRPDIMWAVRNDGELLGLTFKSKEDVSGWHRHILGGTDAKVLSVGVIPQSNNYDQTWVVVERTINSVTRRYVEYITSELDFPEDIEYYIDQTTETNDNTKFLNAMFEAQKKYIHVDSALSYNGADYTSTVGATVTPASISGTAVTFTSDVDIFLSGSVGNQIWKKRTDSDDIGIEVTGRAEITAFTDVKNVTCNIIQNFDSVTAISPGQWYLTAGALSGLDHLEGETVKVVTDGSVHPDETVVDGAITLDYEASVVHVGLGYTGLFKSMLLELGGVSGPGYTKIKNIYEVYFMFLNTLGAKFGLSLYEMEQLVFRTSASIGSRPQPLFSGVKQLRYPDNWRREKYLYVAQEFALPCVVQFLDLYGEVSDEG